MSISSISSRLASFYPTHCHAPYSPHPPTPQPSIYLAYSLFWPYFSSSRSLLIFPQPSSTHLTGVWAFNIQSMPPSSEPSFSSAGFDRQVPPPSPFPLPPRPYRSRRMREEDVGREEGETECPPRTAVAEQTDRWAKGCGGGGGGGGVRREPGRAERPPPVGDGGDRQTRTPLHRANGGAG